MRQNLLLLEDVEDLGRSGEIVSVRPGYARNFLIPKKKALVAKEHTLRMQKRLQEERAARAVVDKKDSEELAKLLANITLEIKVKVDPEGKMYGSVNAQDILMLLEEKGFKLDKKSLVLKHPIKETGSFSLNFKLKEEVTASCNLEIIPEGKQISEKAPKIEESQPENENEDVVNPEE